MMSESTPIKTPDGAPLVLSQDEYCLALLWLTDFEQDWDGIEAATAFVPDGPAKLALLRTRLQPSAGSLAGLGQRIAALNLLIARHWFRNGVCAAPSAGRPPT